jgi:glycosyltransferase involved in cell wall biosynthesis
MGPYLRVFQEKIRKMGLQKRVIYMGYVTREKLIQLYKNATVHVLPSHYEGFPTVLLEAMSCGLPVVATNIGGNNEVISSGVNGLLVPPKCPEAMADAILRLIGDASLREQIGKAARKTVEDNYTWDKISEKFIKCYESIV